MILLKRHIQCPEPLAHYHSTRRRRLNDSSAMAVSQSVPEISSLMGTHSISETIPPACPNPLGFCTYPNVTFPTSFVRKRQPCPQKPRRTAAGITELPTELLLKVFSYLPLIDNIKVAQTCRRFYTLSQDSSLRKHLDLSGLCIPYNPSAIPTHSITTLLSTAHSLTIIPPFSSTTRITISPPSSPTYEPTLLHSLYHIASSPNLTSLTLRALPRKYIGQLHFLFSDLQSTKLTHIDLGRTNVPNHLLSLIVSRFGRTLVSLDLEFAVITDMALVVLGREGVPRLRELGLAGCLCLSKGALRKFLCGDSDGEMSRAIGRQVEVLDLKWGMDVEIGWVEDWLKWRAQLEMGVVTGSVDLTGCERVTKKGVEELRRRWPGMEVKFGQGRQ